jgi:hypothetical protein
LTSFDIFVNVKVAITLKYFVRRQIVDISDKHGISKLICKCIITLVITSILKYKNIDFLFLKQIIKFNFSKKYLIMILILLTYFLKIKAILF